MNTGRKHPGIGDQCPIFDVKDVFGVPVSVGRTLVAGRPTLLMFADPDCAVIAKVLRAVQSISRREGADVVLISRDVGNDMTLGEPGARYWLAGMRHVVSTEISAHFRSDSRTYGVLLDAQGIIVASGRCTSRRHVEALFNVQRRGYYSLYGYLTRVSRNPRPVLGWR